MATDGVAAPIAVRSRPAWIEGLVGQLLALLASLGIAVLAGSLLIVAYGENPLEVYSSILDASMGSADGIGYVLAIATPLIFAALAVAVCFKGGSVQHRGRGSVPRRDGHGRLGRDRVGVLARARSWWSSS